ncbi:MAG: tetratricopeptide repeat protein [Sphingomonadales bacterium]|nr:tetratricopeptide repeat protein [Sphingomonadales bacterium]
MAQSQLESGQIAAARRTIRDAVQDRDDIAELQLLRGRIELAAGSVRTAYEAYSNALSLDSSNVEALLGVANLGLQVGRIEESEDAADRILTLDPNNISALLIKGIHHTIKRKFEDALKDADAIIAIRPSDEGAVILKARALALLGRQDEAYAAVDTAVKASGETVGLAITQLELHRRRDEGPEMVAILERLRRLAPNERKHDIDEANTLYKLGDAPRARAILQGALVAKPLSDGDAQAIGRLWNEYDPNPFDAPALRQFASKAGLAARKVVARFFIDHNQPDQADAALAGAPAGNDVAALRARIAVLRGNPADALAKANAILAGDATHCDALLAKARASLAVRRGDDAVLAAQTAAANCPGDPAGYLTLADAHAQRGDPSGVSLAFRDGFDNNLQDSLFARRYVDWLLRNGQKSRALAIARRLTGAAPALISGWQLYGELCAQQPEARCSDDAKTGLDAARHLYGVDLRTGEQGSAGLLGRLPRR